MATSFLGQDDTIFKYRSFGSDNSDTRKFAHQLVANCEAFFAPPSSFNDIYEGLPSFAMDIATLPDDIQTALRKLETHTVRAPYGITTSDFQVDLNVTLNSGIDWTPFELAAAALLDQMFGVFCASLTPRSLQQWGYYGDSHHGFCVEFRPDDNLLGYRIEYAQMRPRADIVTLSRAVKEGLRDVMLPFLLTKDLGWQHEQEVRFLAHAPGPMRIARKVERIYLGCRTTEKEETLVRDWLREGGMRNVPVEKLLRDNRAFSVRTAAEKPVFTLRADVETRFPPMDLKFVPLNTLALPPLHGLNPGQSNKRDEE